MKKTIDEKFFEYHKANPNIYELFIIFTREAKRSGRKHYSIWAIANRIRWHINIEVHSKDCFKISNNHLSRYARLLMKLNPEFKGFFRIKNLKEFSVLDYE
jgi:hypothetical protein